MRTKAKAKQTAARLKKSQAEVMKLAKKLEQAIRAHNAEVRFATDCATAAIDFKGIPGKADFEAVWNFRADSAKLVVPEFKASSLK